MFPSFTTQITANPGGGQLNATPLSQDVNRILTVATVGDSVKLPLATSPTFVIVINATSNAVQIFGSGTDTINGVASSTGIPQLGNSIDFYVAGAPGQWFVESGLGFSGPFPTISSTNNITATAAGTQSTSLQVSTAINRITTVVSIGDAVKLPVANAGMQLIIANASANSMNVFPGVGDAVGALSANAAFAIAAGKTVEFFTANPGNWHTVLSA